MKTIFIYVLQAMLLMAPLAIIHAQEGKPLQIFDAEDGAPISGFRYRYGTQLGSSDTSGTIFLRRDPGSRLRLQHLRYGTWELTESAFDRLWETGSSTWQPEWMELSPVSVISIGIPQEKDQQIAFSAREKLHHDAGALLNENPMISSIRKSGAFGFDPVMRGFKYDQINVVVDGLQSATAACPNRMDPPTSQIALGRMQKVELLKGPHALRYGIGLGGTLNFVSEAPEFVENPATYGRFSSMWEQNGQVLRNEGKLGWRTQQADMGLIGSWSRGSDYRDGAGNTVPASFMRASVGFYGDFATGAGENLSVNLNRNFARDVAFPTLPMDLRKDDTWMANARFKKSFEGRLLKSITQSAYLSKVDHLMDNGLREINPRMMDARTPAKTANAGGRVEGEWHPGTGRLFAGLDFRSEKAEGTRERTFLMGPNEGKTLLDNAWQEALIQKFGVFTAYSLPLKAGMFSISGRLDMNRAQALDPTVEFSQQFEEISTVQANPGLSLGWQNDLSDRWQIGIWLARVSRSGSLTERYIHYFPVGLDPYELLGNPQLQSETNNQFDLSLQHRTEGLSISVSLFGAYLNDYITGVRTDLAPRLPQSPGVRQFINVEEVLKTGMEWSIEHRIGGNWSQSLMAAYTYGQDLRHQEPLPEIAPLDLRYSLQGKHLDGKLTSVLRWRAVAAQHRVSSRFGESTTPGFHLVDLEGGYRLLPALTLRASVHNLLDQTYYEHLNRPIRSQAGPLFAPGRNFRLMVSVDF